jgi:hypothetical protein
MEHEAYDIDSFSFLWQIIGMDAKLLLFTVCKNWEAIFIFLEEMTFSC